MTRYIQTPKEFFDKFADVYPSQRTCFVTETFLSIPLCEQFYCEQQPDSDHGTWVACITFSSEVDANRFLHAVFGDCSRAVAQIEDRAKNLEVCDKQLQRYDDRVHALVTASTTLFAVMIVTSFSKFRTDLREDVVKQPHCSTLYLTSGRAELPDASSPDVSAAERREFKEYFQRPLEKHVWRSAMTKIGETAMSENVRCGNHLKNAPSMDATPSISNPYRTHASPNWLQYMHWGTLSESDNSHLCGGMFLACLTKCVLKRTFSTRREYSNHDQTKCTNFFF